MIHLTRLHNKPLIINSDLIKFVEQSPDTIITLTTGEKIVVLEKPDEVLGRVIEFRRSVLHGLCGAWDSSPSHAHPPRTAESGSAEPEK
ncbi:MAG TPA: flagellar FlbD family protein [Candidatus Solibacter sp.]|nr:flagellar FlbD family protein [Candidatus Solibacter sp.]